MAEWQQYFLQYGPPKHPTLTHSRPSTPLSQAGSCREQNPQLHPISFLINDTNYRALNSMCLRMGEDTQAAISLSLNSLFISLIFSLSLPSPDAHESPIPSLQVPFLNSPLFFFFFQPLVCSLCASFWYLFNLLPSVSFLSPSLSACLLLGSSYAVPITLTTQDAVHARVFFCLCACLSLFEGQVQGLGTHPICYQRETDQRREKKFKKIKTRECSAKQN